MLGHRATSCLSKQDFHASKYICAALWTTCQRLNRRVTLEACRQIWRAVPSIRGRARFPERGVHSLRSGHFPATRSLPNNPRLEAVLALSCASCRVQNNRDEYRSWSHQAAYHGCPIAQASRAKAAAKMRGRHASQEKPRVALKCDTPSAPNRTPPTRSASVSKSATSESDRRAGYRARWVPNRLCRRTGCRRAIAFGVQRPR